jgi:hypothetical protein
MCVYITVERIFHELAMTQEPAFQYLLMNSVNEPIPEPSISDIQKWLTKLNKQNSIVLYNADKSHIRADGISRSQFTIVYYLNAQSKPLIIGRSFESFRRGVAEISDNYVLVTPYEYWSTEDGSKVFENFLQGVPLRQKFILRDPQTVYTKQEIETLLTKKASLPNRNAS